MLKKIFLAFNYYFNFWLLLAAYLVLTLAFYSFGFKPAKIKSGRFWPATFVLLTAGLALSLFWRQQIPPFFLKLEFIFCLIAAALLWRLNLTQKQTNKFNIFWPKKIYYFFFLLIVLNFIFYRLPFFTQPFNSQFNPDKYVTYVPIAQNMAKANNPFLFKNQAYASVLSLGNEQNFSCFWRLPLFDWGLALFFKAAGVLPIEALVRIYLTILGIIFLFLFFLFFQKLFTTPIAVLSAFFLSLTPLFHLLTWLTTLDLPALIFLFLALNFFIRGRRNLAYVLLGFSIITKLSFLIIGLSLFFVLALKEKRPFLALADFLLFASLPIIGWRLFIYYLPQFPQSIILKYLFVCLFFAFIFFAYRLFNKVNFSKLNLSPKAEVWLFLGLAGWLAALFWFAYQDDILKLPALFLTDKKLLFDFQFYQILLKRFKQINLDFLYYSAPAAVLFWPFLPRRQRLYLRAFFFSSLLFFVLSSKSIRFAIYYNHIFVLTNILLLAGWLYLFVYSVKIKKSFKAALIVLLLIIVFQTAFGKIFVVYKPNFYLAPIAKISRFIKSKTAPTDKILAFSSKYKTAFLYSGRPVILVSDIISDQQVLTQLRKEINDYGFKQAMASHQIKFLLANKDDKDFSQLTYLFSPDLKPEMPLRTEKILEKLKPFQPAKNKRLEHFWLYRPDKYFSLAAEFAPTRIYAIKD